jgi:hypothetical protein
MLQPHVSNESPVSELRFDSCLQCCWIKSIQIIDIIPAHIITCGGACSISYMKWSLPWPEHLISDTFTAIGGKLVTEENLCAASGTWLFVHQSMMWVIAPIHVNIQQFNHENRAILPYFQVFLQGGCILLTVTHQALTIISVSTSMGNVDWQQQSLCCLIASVYCVGIQWIFAHPVQLCAGGEYSLTKSGRSFTFYARYAVWNQAIYWHIRPHELYLTLWHIPPCFITSLSWFSSFL